MMRWGMIGVCWLVLLGGSAGGQDGWMRAEIPRTLHFPRDHGAHPAFKVEWWYYTGNVADRNGRRFGYQLTFFRIGVDPVPANPSRWAVRDLYMAHLAVTDIGAGRFHYADRVNRAGVGWAGAGTDSLHVWNRGWDVRLDPGGVHRLQAQEKGLGVDLSLTATGPPVPHGEAGLSRKGALSGNATYYYSIMRLVTRGEIIVDGKKIPVTGLSWMDHEFGTSFLEPEQQGWDWLSIQLDDGTDLMLFQLRRNGGGRDRHSSGTLVEASGAPQAIRFEDFDLRAARRWRSKSSGAEYPVVWTIAIPSKGIELTVRAAVDDQELRTTHSAGIVYWEGAVEVAGRHSGHPVHGRGYLEMTGYAGLPMGGLIR